MNEDWGLVVATTATDASDAAGGGGVSSNVSKASGWIALRGV
jgi:hypothetical protein